MIRKLIAERYPPRPLVDLEALADMAASMIEGGMIVGRALRDQTILPRQVLLYRDYVRTARAKGLHERAVVARHALKNALIPVVTVLGLQFGTLLGGAVVIETVFARPGIGQLVVKAILTQEVRRKVNRPPVAVTTMLAVPGNGVLPLPPVPANWVDVKRQVQLEILDGNRVALSGANVGSGQPLPVAVQGRPCWLNATMHDNEKVRVALLQGGP